MAIRKLCMPFITTECLIKNSSMLSLSLSLCPAEWIFGEHMCKMVSFCQGVSVTASVYTLIAISLERCIVVACPFSALLPLPKCILSIWALSIIVNLPWIMVYRLETVVLDSSGTVAICLEEWPSRQAESVYFAFACLSIGYLCPLFAIATCNFVIWRTVINRQAIGEDVFSQQRAEIHQTKIKVNICIRARAARLQ